MNINEYRWYVVNNKDLNFSSWILLFKYHKYNFYKRLSINQDCNNNYYERYKDDGIYKISTKLTKYAD